MRLAIPISRLIVGLVFISSLFSCSDDSDTLFVKRDTDELNFTYKKTSQQFSVRTNGIWNASSPDEWISLSPDNGSGNGKEHEYVTVSVNHNSSDEREGTVYLEAAGRTIEIKVHQEDGILSWGEPYIDGTMLEGEPINEARVILPYTKASGDEIFDVNLKISGEGGSGISCDSLQQQLSIGDGAIIVPLKGMPYSMGDMLVTITLEPKSTTQENISFNTKGFVSSENIIFEMTFDKLVWGGDYINNLPGVSAPTGYNVNATDATTRACKATDDGTSDLMAAAMNAGFRASRGITDWSGSKVYEKPGYVKVGTGAAKGYIISPKLDLEALGCNAISDIYVQFNWSRWDNENDPITVDLVGDGEMESIVLDNTHPYREWQLLTFKIKNATKNTQVRVGSTVAGNNRFFIDNWRVYVSKGVAPSVTSKLTTPTGLNIDEATPSSLKFSWDKHPNATSYLIELKDSEKLNTIASQVITTTTYTFEELTINTKYNCQIKALYSPNTEFDSDFTNYLEASTLAGEKLQAPAAVLFKATHGMLVFDFGTFIDGSQESRIYTFELAETSEGKAIRSYKERDLDSGIATTTGDNGTGTRLFFTKNRIAFAALKPNTTYYLRIKRHPLEGSAFIDSDYSICEGKTLNMPTLSEKTLLSKDFEDFWWGGNSINLAWGPLPLVAPINEQKLSSSLNPESDFHIHYPIRNAGDSFNTLSSDNAPEYFKSRWGSEGWSGSKVYEVTGHIKLGTASATGYITTPPLSNIGSESADITLTFKAAPYHEPTKAEDILDLVVKVVGNGTITNVSSGSITSEKNATMQNKTNVSGTELLTGEYEWTAHEIKISGADAATKLTISTATYDKNNSSRKIRMWVDDIKIERN